MPRRGRHSPAARRPADVRLLDGYVTRLALKWLADVRRAPRHLLHLDVHRPVGQAVQGPDHRPDDARSSSTISTPQFVFFIIPLTVLIGAMVTVGVLTKNSELVVMQACGISLYRVAVPLVLIARTGERRHVRSAGPRPSLFEPARGGDQARDSRRLTADLRCRQSQVAHGARRQIYNYTYYDPRLHELNGLSIFDFDTSHGTRAPRLRRQRTVHPGFRPRVAFEKRVGARVRERL